MTSIGPPDRRRPLTWLPLSLYCLLGVVAFVATILVFKLLGFGGPDWIVFAVAGGIVGGLFGVVYPWLYDRVEAGRSAGS